MLCLVRRAAPPDLLLTHLQPRWSALGRSALLTIQQLLTRQGVVFLQPLGDLIPVFRPGESQDDEQPQSRDSSEGALEVRP